MLELEACWNDFAVFRETQVSVPIKLATTKDPQYFCKCGGLKELNEDNLPVCTSCGVTDSMYIDDTAEWASNVDETGQVNDGSRCGAPKDLELFSEQWGASTIINTKGKSYATKRIARLNFHMSMNHKDRALYHAYKGMDDVAKTKLSLPDSVIRDAKIMYRKFNNEKLTRGAVRTGIKANCILNACKIHKIPRTTREIADAFEIPTKDISRTSQLFKDTMLEGVKSEKEKVTSSSITKPVDVCSRILNNFQCEEKRKMSAKCRKFCEHLENCVDLMGKNPSSVVYVVIMKMLGIPKNEMSDQCKISPPTLVKIENIIDKYLETKPFEL